MCNRLHSIFRHSGYAISQALEGIALAAPVSLASESHWQSLAHTQARAGSLRSLGDMDRPKPGHVRCGCLSKIRYDHPYKAREPIRE